MDELDVLLKRAERNIEHTEKVTIDIASEYPTQSQIEYLFSIIEQSNITDRFEDHIRFNYRSFKIDEFWSYFNQVLDQTFIPDPRKQWVRFNYKLSNPTHL